MKESVGRFLLFVVRHRMFSLFFLVSLSLTIYMFVHEKQEQTIFLTCSSFDKGPLGTYGFYESLRRAGVDVRRIRLSPYHELDEREQQGATLIILSPFHPPAAWEWDRILTWIAAGNRLITGNLYGPQQKFFGFPTSLYPRYSRVERDSVRVLLPCDSVHTPPYALPPTPWIGSNVTFMKRIVPDSQSIVVHHYAGCDADMIPFLSTDGKVVSVKKAVGKGEWTIFTFRNPFSNTLLQERRWFDFAVAFCTGNAKYGNGPLLFDEYHNGYTASKNLWQLLSYYKFDEGILFCSALILIYLFFSGIRILKPAPPFAHTEKDPIPGLRAMGTMLYRYRAWSDLIKREVMLVCRGVAATGEPAPQTGAACARMYRRKGALPPGFSTDEQFAVFLTDLMQDTREIDKETALRAFTTLYSMRKELKR